MDHNKRPSWINKHPKDYIFSFSENGSWTGSVWYRPIEVGFEIDYIEINVKLRNQGFGHKLVQEFINFCRSKKNELSFEIWLEVSVLNTPAIKLYQKVGFKAVHIRPKYYSDGSDATVMTLTISELL